MQDKIQSAITKQEEWIEEQTRQSRDRVTRLRELAAMHTATTDKLAKIEAEAEGHIEATEKLEGIPVAGIRLAG